MPVGQANLFGLHQFDNQTSFFNGHSIFSPAQHPTFLWVHELGVGYAIIFGYGTLFAVLTIVLTILDGKYVGTRHDSEEFNTAGRSINTGLIAVDVVSHWTWVADLLQSSNYAFQYGISGSFWYAASAAVQILLSGIVAMEVKRRAPKAHTVVELVRRRWGHTASFVFLYLCYLNNIVTCATLFLGAGNVLVAATGMNMYAALNLIPFSVVTYTVIGGLKATFTSSYLHTVIIYVTLNLFVFKVYASDAYPVGSIQRVWKNLATCAKAVPAPGNKDGSYMTMFSRGGFEFGVLTLISCFGNVWADQAYWQCYVLHTCGVEDRASKISVWICSVDPYPLDYKGGVILMITIVFMAATSSGSAEFIAMSSLFTYDIYKINVDVNFLFLVVGLLVCSSVPPLSFMLVWPPVPKNAAIVGALGGQMCAIIAWVVHAKIVYHELSVSHSLQQLGPTLDGALVALLVSTIICTVWTLIAPDSTGSYNRFKEIEVMEEVDMKTEETLKLDASFCRASAFAVFLSVVMVVVWPLLTLPAGVFSESYFALWVVISIVWAVIATGLCTFLPLMESRDVLVGVVKSLIWRKKPSSTDQT